MSDPQLPDSLETRLRKLEDKMSTVEKVGTSGLSGGGTATSVDTDGNERVHVGSLGNGHYGVRVLRPGSTTAAFYVDENGMSVGGIPTPPPTPTPQANLQIVQILSPNPLVESSDTIFAAEVKNVGDAPTPSGSVVDVKFEMEGGAEVRWSTNQTATLAPGQSRIQYANKGGFYDDGSWSVAVGSPQTIKATVNVGDITVGRPAVPESNTTDNSLTITVPTTPAPAAFPDLVLVGGTVGYTGQSGPGAQINEGDHIVWHVDVQNIGSVATPAGATTPMDNHLTVQFVVPDDAIGGNTWTDTDITPLGAGATRTKTVDGGSLGHAYWTATLGSHTLAIEVNPTVGSGRRIFEQNTSNNTLSYPFTVSSGTTPPPSGSSKLMVWGGTWDAIYAKDPSTKLNYNQLMAHGVRGFAWSHGHLDSPVSYNQDLLAALVPVFDEVFSVSNIGDYSATQGAALGLGTPTGPPRTTTEANAYKSTLTTYANQALAAGCYAMGFDTEPYGFGRTAAWEGTSGDRTFIHAFGVDVAAIVQIVSPICYIYMSSDVSWPNSNQDQIALQNSTLGGWGGLNAPPPGGASSYYVNNIFPDFVDGLIAGGCTVILGDATFQFANQNRGSMFPPATITTWRQGVQRATALQQARWPGSNVLTSCQFWADNTDIDPDRLWGGSEIADVAEAAHKDTTGYSVMYQHGCFGTTASNGEVDYSDYYLGTVLPAVATGRARP